MAAGSATDAAGLPDGTRLALLDRFGLFGVRLATSLLRRGVEDSAALAAELEVMGRPLVSVVAFTARNLNIYDIADAMSQRGWHLNSLQEPPAMHVAVTMPITKVWEKLTEDLEAVIEEEREKDRALRAQEDEERWACLAAASESVAAAVAADTGEVATAAAVEDIPAEEAGPAPPLPAAAEETLDEVFEADPTPEPTEPPVSWRELLEDPQRWGPALQALYDRKAAQVAGLYSERRVTVRTRDLTIIALEGAAAGVLFAGSTAVAVVLFLRR